MKRDLIAEGRARQVAVKVVTDLQDERDALYISLLEAEKERDEWRRRALTSESMVAKMPLEWQARARGYVHSDGLEQ